MRLPLGRLPRWNRGRRLGSGERAWRRRYLIFFAVALVLAALIILAGSVTG
jgi:hypothetical protein